MEDLKKVLQKLDDADMHIHAIERGVPLPVHVAAWDTHFVMHGSEIVHTGTLTSIERFALSL